MRLADWAVLAYGTRRGGVQNGTLGASFAPSTAGHPLCLAETVLTSTERLVETNGVQLRVTEAGDRGAPVVVLAHGFPELAYSWRHQIPVLAEAGYRVLAPDQRGYGGSIRPEAVEDYDIVALTGDLVGLLDDVGAEQAVIIGHDWGAMVVWHAALLHPDRVRAVAGLSVPPIPRPRCRPPSAGGRSFGDNFFYILYFQEPGRPTPNWRDPARRCAAWATDERGLCRRRLLDRARADGCRTGSAQDEFDHYVDRVQPNRLHRRAELVPQLRPQLGADRDTPTRRSPCPRCSSRAPRTRCWPDMHRDRVREWSPVRTAKC